MTAAEAYETVHPDDRALPRLARERAMAEGGPYEAEYRRVLADGSIRWYRNRGIVELGADPTKPVPYYLKGQALIAKSPQLVAKTMDIVQKQMLDTQPKIQQATEDFTHQMKQLDSTTPAKP